MQTNSSDKSEGSRMHKSLAIIALHLPKTVSGSRLKGGGRLGGLGGAASVVEADDELGEKKEVMNEEDRFVADDDDDFKVTWRLTGTKAWTTTTTVATRTTTGSKGLILGSCPFGGSDSCKCEKGQESRKLNVKQCLACRSEPQKIRRSAGDV
jgi:hypothetical protein